MAYKSMARWIFSLFFMTFSLVHALRVSPNSPCTNVCTTSDVSQSDPKFFDDQWKDIVCDDKDFDSKPEGQKLKSCFTCLQNSTYTHGSENDQDWFLYNLRYSSGYCMFGYPNNTGIETGPCTTSVGCGNLASALELGIKSPANSTPYDYCDANGGVITSGDVDGCLECVKADGQHQYLSNFLLALQGACEAKPAPGSILILNNTLFGNSNIQVVDQTPSTNYEEPKLSSSAIVGIAIGGVVLLALATGFTYMCIRKRKNRAKQEDRASGYSFRCQTRVTPVTPRFPDDAHADGVFQGGEKTHVKVTTGVGAEPYPVDRYPWNSQSSLNVTISRQDSAMMRPSIITALTPPTQAYISPRASSPDDFATPASAVSTRSNAPFLVTSLLDSRLLPT
ncbi:hypothetical protein TrVFT333_011272 [Trichoderma virens FT-333]|nr:hypothetical protein TrVFT333_011272 [Trichoderma virens FT-333]